MDSTPEMNCPKCGARQVESNTCFQCHVIISKFLEKQQEADMAPTVGSEAYGGYGAPNQYAPAASTSSPSSSSSLPIGKFIFIAIIAAAGWFIWDGGYISSAKGGFDAETGIYVNKRHGFSLKIPSSWNTFNSIDKAMPWVSMGRGKNHFYFFASPGHIIDGTIIIQKTGLDEESMKSEGGLAGVAGMLARSTKGTFRSPAEKEIGGLQTYRFKIELSDASSSINHLFLGADGTLVRIYYYVNDETTRDGRKTKRQMKKVLETLKKI